MAFSFLSLFMVFFFVSLNGFQLGFSSQFGNFITWEDIRIENYFGRMRITDRDNSSRVIMVAKDGSGDSYTVQGAIDLIPDFNNQRVKIWILPGIYRFVFVYVQENKFLYFIQGQVFIQKRYSHFVVFGLFAGKGC